LRSDERSKVRCALDKNEAIGFLLLKDYEEWQELCNAVRAKDQAAIIDEIVDQLDVIDALIAKLRISHTSISKRRLQKARERGRFTQGYLLTLN